MQAVFPGAKVWLNTAKLWFHLQTHHYCEYAAMESQERPGQPVVAAVPMLQ